MLTAPASAFDKYTELEGVHSAFSSPRDKNSGGVEQVVATAGGVLRSQPASSILSGVGSSSSLQRLMDALVSSADFVAFSTRECSLSFAMNFRDDTGVISRDLRDALESP